MATYAANYFAANCFADKKQPTRTRAANIHLARLGLHNLSAAVLGALGQGINVRIAQLVGSVGHRLQLGSSRPWAVASRSQIANGSGGINGGSA